MTIDTIGVDNEIGLDSYWASYVDSYRFADQNYINTFEKQYGVLMTGSASISGPQEHVTAITTYVLKNLKIKRVDNI